MPDVTPLPKPIKHKKVPKRDRDAAEIASLMPALIHRSGGRCEVAIESICEGAATNVHHRKPRGQGGRNVMRNLLHLCGSGTTGCHGYIEHNRDVSYTNGWLVRQQQAPGQVPVISYRKDRQ